MFATATVEKPLSANHTVVAAPKATSTSSPPIIISSPAKQKTISQIAKATKLLPEIFGDHVPKGFKLSQQSIPSLRHYLRITGMAFSAEKKKCAGGASERLVALQITEQRILEAMMGAIPPNANQATMIIKAVAETIARHQLTQIDSVMSVVNFMQFAADLDEVTQPPTMKKEVGPLRRGEKLTRAGLLYRYHAFLLGELNTVGEELYGDAAYAQSFKAEDRAVFQRLGRRAIPDKGYPLFSHTRIRERAKAVLGSLQIDTERDLDAQRDDRGDIIKAARSYRRTR